MDVNQQHDVAMPFRQLLDGMQQEIHVLALRADYLRIVILPGPHKRQVWPRCLHQFVEAQGRAPFLAAQMVIARIGDDAQQPGAEIAVLEARQRAVHLDERVLDGIRGGLFRRHNVLRQSLRRRLVVSDKLAKRKVIAKLCSLNHI